MYQCLVRSYHFGVFETFHWLDQDATAVNFHHDHDVFVAREQSFWKLSSLIRENGLPYFVYFGKVVSFLLVFEFAHFHRDCFGLVGQYIFACLVHVSFGCGCCFGVVFLDIACR